MTIDEMITGAGWVETVIARNETAALVAAAGKHGPMKALFYLTAGDRPRMVQWHASSADGATQAARTATNDGATEADVFAVIEAA